MSLNSEQSAHSASARAVLTRVPGLLAVAGAAALAWGGLTGFEAGAWWIGAPTVVLTTAVAAAAGLPEMAPRLHAVPRFTLGYAVELGQASAELARRLTHRDPGFAPGLLTHRLRLQGLGARAAFMNAVTLTPGSLSVALTGDDLLVHALDGDDPATRASLNALQNDVADLYGETP
jgi:multisubunit Na+/H+ antiporter MnhE subunit